MSNILIENVELNAKPVDILIEGRYIKKIAAPLSLSSKADFVIDGRRKAVIPGLINTHTHSAMTLFRGAGDDMSLIRWLEEKIWPKEALLTREDVYWGAKLACLEMIKSGTTTFVDSYHQMPATAEAVRDMGIRGALACACFDSFSDAEAESVQHRIENHHRIIEGFNCENLSYSLAPHAIYTVSYTTLQWLSAYAKDNNLLMQLHLAETEWEMEHSVSHFGCSPVRYLHRLGILSPNLLIAHGLYIDDDEIAMLADSGVSVAHNPASNMKLASGYAFKFDEMRRAGIKIGIGTDGCSSSNNLDMIEAMKLASLLGKAWRRNPEVLSAKETFDAATCQGADILGLNAGRIEEGRLADICLIDLNIPAFTPNFDFVSNLVYAANGICVDTLICNGRILMLNRKVEGENEIMDKAAAIAFDLMNRKK